MIVILFYFIFITFYLSTHGSVGIVSSVKRFHRIAYYVGRYTCSQTSKNLRYTLKEKNQIIINVTHKYEKIVESNRNEVLEHHDLQEQDL